MSWVAVGVAGGAVLGGGAGFMGSKTKKNYDPYGELNPEQKQMTQALGPYLTNQINTDPKLYEGQLSEPISNEELGIVGSSNRLAAMSESGYSDLINPDLNAYNKQFDEQMANPQYSMFRRNVLPGIQEAMPTFSTAMGETTKRGYQDVTDTLSQQRYAGWQAAQDRRLQAMGQAPSTMAQFGQNAAVPRALQQAGLDRSYSEWMRGQDQKNTSVNQMLSFLGLRTSTTEYTKPLEPYANMITGAMKGATWGGSLGLGGGGTTPTTGGTGTTLPNVQMGSSLPRTNAYGL